MTELEIKNRIWDFIYNLIDVEKKFTRSSLATRLGVARSTVCEWYNRNTLPDAVRVALLCEACDITPNELYGIKNINDLPKADKARLDVLHNDTTLCELVDRLIHK